MSSVHAGSFPELIEGLNEIDTDGAIDSEKVWSILAYLIKGGCRVEHIVALSRALASLGLQSFILR